MSKENFIVSKQNLYGLSIVLDRKVSSRGKQRLSLLKEYITLIFHEFS